MEELNEIKGEKRKSFLYVFLSQFSDLLVIILIICGIVSYLFNDINSAIVVFFVLVLNAFIGTIQYQESVKSVEALKKYNNLKVKVIKNNKEEIIDSIYLKINDIVLLNSGDKIPADGIIIDGNASINEANLTGESNGINKMIGDDVYSSTLILKGHIKVRIKKIGMNTKIGEIAHLLNKTKKSKTPLERKLDKLSKNLATAILIFSCFIYFINLYKGMSILDSIMFSVSLAVAAIPEALGTIVTIVLSVGSMKMAKEKAIVKDLMSIETLGCINVLATDKTGTITKNIMKLENIFTLSNDKIIKNGLLMCINNDDPIDKAINKYYNDTIIYNRIKEIDFDSTRKMFTTLNYFNNEYYVFSKGAFEKIMANSNKILVDNKEVVFDQNYRQMIKNKHDVLANDGFRIIALSYKKSNILNEKDMTFLGLVSFYDPIKEESIESIKLLKDAGIKVLMLTGDYEATGVNIAKKIGLNGITKGLNKDVYARVSPKDKIDIIDEYQSKGNVICMTGDGINDAPALKKADVGISMGSGTDVSNEASDIILLDDNLYTIVNAVKSGRGLFLNIRNAVRFLLSGNLGGIFCVLFSSIFNYKMPFLAIHLLFINLLTDSIPAIAIGVSNPSNNLLKMKPRSQNESIITMKLLFRIIIEGLIIFLVTIIGYLYGLKISYLKATTMAFIIMSLTRLFHSLNCLYQGSIFKYGIKNKYCILSIIVGLFLVSMVIYLPLLKDIFKVYTLTNNDLIVLLLLAISPTLLIQTIKLLKEEFL